MDKEKMNKEHLYHVTMTVAKNLLNKGVINEKEYNQIDTKFQEKYEISLSTLFTDISLIKLGTYGNM